MSTDLEDALALHRDWLVTMYHVPAEHLHAAIQEHNTKVRILLERPRAEPTLDGVMDHMMRLARAAGFHAHVKLTRPKRKKSASLADHRRDKGGK